MCVIRTILFYVDTYCNILYRIINSFANNECTSNNVYIPLNQHYEIVNVLIITRADLIMKDNVFYCKCVFRVKCLGGFK